MSASSRLLPEPVGPTMLITSPALISIETFSFWRSLFCPPNMVRDDTRRTMSVSAVMVCKKAVELLRYGFIGEAEFREVLLAHVPQGIGLRGLFVSPVRTDSD